MMRRLLRMGPVIGYVSRQDSCRNKNTDAGLQLSKYIALVAGKRRGHLCDWEII